MKPLILAVSVVTVAVAAAACGPKSSIAPVDGADAQAAGGALGNSAENSAGGVGAGGASFSTACPNGGSYDVSPTPVQDSDGDGVPDALLITYTQCMVVDTATGGTAKFDGQIGAQDDTPNTSDYVFTKAWDMTEDFATASSTTSAHLVIKGAQKAQQPASSFKMDDLLGVVTDYTSPASGAVHMEEAHAWSVTYTPSGAWNPGQPLVNGGLDLAGFWTIKVQDHQSKAATSSTGLVIDASCPTHIVSGTLNAAWQVDGQNALLKVIWNGCGNRSVVYAGPAGTS